MKILIKILPVSAFLLPTAALAAPLTNTQGLIAGISDIVKDLILVAAGAALLVFFFGLVKFIFKVGGDEKAVTQGKTLMIWGLIALFVMISVWGIIAWLQMELFGGSPYNYINPKIPNFK